MYIYEFGSNDDDDQLSDVMIDGTTEIEHMEDEAIFIFSDSDNSEEETETATVVNHRIVFKASDNSSIILIQLSKGCVAAEMQVTHTGNIQKSIQILL